MSTCQNVYVSMQDYYVYMQGYLADIQFTYLDFDIGKFTCASTCIWHHVRCNFAIYVIFYRHETIWLNYHTCTYKKYNSPSTGEKNGRCSKKRAYLYFEQFVLCSRQFSSFKQDTYKHLFNYKVYLQWNAIELIYWMFHITNAFS